MRTKECRFIAARSQILYHIAYDEGSIQTHCFKASHICRSLATCKGRAEDLSQFFSITIFLSQREYPTYAYLFLYSITCSHCQIWIVQRKVVPRDTNISVKTKLSHSSITIYITRQWIEVGRIPACLSVTRFARTFIILQFVCSASMSLRASSDCILA